MQIRAYSHRIRVPAVAGYEGTGRVIEAPETMPFLPGKRVLPLRGEGTWQTIVDCDARDCVLVPDGISDIDAARAYINPLTAHRSPLTAHRSPLTAHRSPLISCSGSGPCTASSSC